MASGRADNRIGCTQCLKLLGAIVDLASEIDVVLEQDGKVGDGDSWQRLHAVLVAVGNELGRELELVRYIERTKPNGDTER
jgi:hypothetical protein